MRANPKGKPGFAPIQATGPTQFLLSPSATTTSSMSGLSFYDSFIERVQEAPQWPAASEQVRPPSLPLEALLTRAAQVLVEPFTYLAAIPGKEVRSALIEAFNLWMHVPEKHIAVVKKVVGMLHTASLL